MTNLPLQDDIEEAQDRDRVAEAYREVGEAMKTHDKDLPHPTANKHYFPQKIAQYKALYNEGNVDARVNRKLTALENYFRDPSSSGGKWTYINDVVAYGGINTGVKFSVYLEYSKTWLKRACSKADTWLKRTHTFGPGRFLYVFTLKNLSKADTVKRTPA